MIDLHKRLPALRQGSVKELLADRQLIAYGRMRGENRCVIVINNRREDSRVVHVPVWELVDLGSGDIDENDALACAGLQCRTDRLSRGGWRADA